MANKLVQAAWTPPSGCISFPTVLVYLKCGLGSEAEDGEGSPESSSPLLPGLRVGRLAQESVDCSPSLYKSRV